MTAAGAPGGDLLLVTVAVAGEEYAVPVERVREVIAYSRPRALPRAGRHVLGVVDLRGEVVPVVSARAAFGLPEVAPTIDTCIVVIETGDGAAGLMVDAVREVTTVSGDRALPPPAAAGEAAAAVSSVVRLDDRLLVVLDVDTVLGPAPVPPPAVPGRSGPDSDADAEPGAEAEADAEPDRETPTAEIELPRSGDEAIGGPVADATSVAAVDDAERVRRVHALLEQHAERAGESFAAELARDSPGLHARLGLDQPLARRRVLAAVGLAVRGLDRPRDLVPALERIGVPVGGATEAECRDALGASVRTLERGLGARFTPELRGAWERVGDALLGAVFLGRPLE